MLRIVFLWPTPFGSDFLKYVMESLEIEYCLSVGEHSLKDSRVEYMHRHHPFTGEIDFEKITPIDEELIMKMSPCESLVFRMMDFDFEFSPDTRYGAYRTQYLKQIRYWNWLLEEKKINLVISCEVPPLFYESAIYYLCRLKNIRFLALGHTPVTGMWCWVESWEKYAIKTYERYLKIRREYSVNSPIILSSFLEKNYQHQLSRNPTPIYMKASAYKSYMATFSEERNQAISVFTDDSKFIAKLEMTRETIKAKLFFYKLLIHSLLPRVPGQTWTWKGKSFLQAISDKIKEPGFILRLVTLDVWMIRRWKNRLLLNIWRKTEVLEQRHRELINNLDRRKLFGFYDRHAVEPDLSKQYIYMALHYQPEGSTMPLAGVFVNQLLIVQLLAYCVPQNVFIYVKEHPNQDLKCRSVNFYKSILDIPNVRLIRRDYSTFELARHSVAVATATGTVGWEALFMGKPVLMFGSYIYQYAPGVIKVKTLEDCQNAINKILHHGFKPNLTELRLFLKAMDETCFIASINEYYDDIVDISKEESMKNLLDNLKEFLPPDIIGSIPTYSNPN